MAPKHEYGLLKEGEDPNDEPQPTTIPVTTSWWKFLLCNLGAAVAGATIMFLIARYSSVIQPATNSKGLNATQLAIEANLTIPNSAIEDLGDTITTPNMPKGQILDCGGTPEEAREKGCIYDVMMQDWLPEPCYDEILTEKYLAEGNWTWYADGQGETTMTDEVMRKGEHGQAWMSTSYHKAHCVFSWMKIIRALRNNKGISQELLSYDHVLHCSHGALKEDSTDEGLGVMAPTNYAKCALYDTWKTDFIPDQHDSSSK